MLSQMIIGFMLESVLGPFRVAILYVVSGIGGILFSCLCDPNARSVGASTAIFGLLGGLVIFDSSLILNTALFGDRELESPG
jgi:membrane associated rhomboid family serine protease